jgi:hypothetical protein
LIPKSGADHVDAGQAFADRPLGLSATPMLAA